MTDSNQTLPDTSDFAPAQRMRWVHLLLPKKMQPIARGLQKRVRRLFQNIEEPYRTVYPYTQVALERQQSLVKLAQTINEQNIPGDIVECGVLDGGTAALMAWATDSVRAPANAPVRRLHLFDAWEGLPETTAKDGQAAGVWAGQVVGSPKRVASVMQQLKIPSERIVFHRGWFSDTFPDAQKEIGQIALLHLDADLYESTKICLDTWYPKLSAGGFVQIDDYDSFSGCRKAVDEFLQQHPQIKLQSVGAYCKVYYFINPPL